MLQDLDSGVGCGTSAGSQDQVKQAEATRSSYQQCSGGGAFLEQPKLKT